MKIIGLCGGSGSGKTLVSEIFSKFRYLPLDTDKIYHGMVSSKSPCLDALVREFGAGILAPDGALDRKKLASIVFADGAKEKHEKLNEITHFYVLSEVRKIIKNLSTDEFDGVAVDAPLLFESGFSEECDFVVSVIADRELRITRITERDAISEDAARRRINSQLSDEFLIRNSDFVIENNSTYAVLFEQVEAVVQKIKDDHK